MPIRVLIVDDSAIIRSLMQKSLQDDGAIEIVGSASNGQMAVEMAAAKKPDIVLLDIEMPVMDGITALPLLLKASPASKVIVASTLTLRNAEISLKALSLGASDYLPKPSAKFGNEVETFYRDLIAKVKALSPQKQSTPAPTPMAARPVMPSNIKLQPATVALHVTGVKALAIASSTGGPQALLTLFASLKGRLQHIPIFITQHMPPAFTTILAEHITRDGARPCQEAKEGARVQPGCTYLAPGDYHMIPKKTDSGEVILTINQDPPENFCRPAADPMLRALSAIYGKQLAVVVLTGMGSDGAEGSKIVVQSGGSVIAQDQASCVVYGMPKAVVDAGICRAVLPLNEIGPYLLSQIEGKP